MTNFAFRPLQKVQITILDKTYGRVQRCILDHASLTKYGVRYVINGEVEHDEFYEDELQAI